MKKKLLCAVAIAAGFMFSNIDANAQISVGPRLGLNMNKVVTSGSDDDSKANEDVEWGTGISGGVAFNIGVNDMFSIQPELLYTQRGSAGKFLGEDAERTMGYIEIPVLARASFGDDTKFFVNVGPSFGLLLSDKIKIGDDEPEDGDGDELDGMNRFDVGLMGGVGVGINAGPGMFTVEARYNFGLTDINEEGDGDESDAKAVHRNIGFSVSYMIPIGG